jgi:hypothetical protein
MWKTSAPFNEQDGLVRRSQMRSCPAVWAILRGPDRHGTMLRWCDEMRQSSCSVLQLASSICSLASDIITIFGGSQRNDLLPGDGAVTYRHYNNGNGNKQDIVAATTRTRIQKKGPHRSGTVITMMIHAKSTPFFQCMPAAERNRAYWHSDISARFSSDMGMARGRNSVGLSFHVLLAFATHGRLH